ncbi:ABC transporter substrate-binding protein [Streptomyces sp. NPDC017964]|uniref:ABC transporter substrate-binding protein n=1 Tax=Streptomyces sp. NPDC017964 TaxID=3365022 RepID=UPI00379C9E60
MTTHRVRAVAASGCLAIAALTLSDCGASPPSTHMKPSVATSAENMGGMDQLIAAAKREGSLNAMFVPRDWAGYGALIDGFEKKYGIKVRDEDPGATVPVVINAVKSRKHQANAPDVIGLGDTYMSAAARQNLLAPYRVATYDAIPNSQKDPQARWANNYGGYISIGCDAKRITQCPQTFADLLKPQYKGKVALNAGDPNTSSSGFAAVYAAALANKGSFDDIQPGLDFFAKLKKAGNFDPVGATTATVENGQTPININWDFLNLNYAHELRSKGVYWQVSIPFDGSFTQYFAVAVNKYAPHPAAARLWMEWLFSTEGQNLRLYGYARPVLMDAMEKDGTLDKAAAARLPTVEGTPQFPTDTQLEKAKAVVARGWAKAISS